MKGFFSIIAVILITGILLVGCTDPEKLEETEIKIEDEKPISGGQLNIACVEPLDFNPINIKNKSYMDVVPLIFNGLYEYDESQKIIPVLAKGIDFDDITRKCTIEIRNDVFWSDGNKLTSEDVKFTLDTIKNTPDSIYKDNISAVLSYKIVDDETITINFGKAYCNVLDKLCFPIIPKHVYSINKASIPIGTGPYKVTDYKKLKHLILEPNSHFWISKKPYIEKIKLQFVDNAYAFDPFFQSREIDVLHASSYDWEKYKELRDVNTHKYVSDGFEFISINHKNSLLADKTVRQAMAYAINRNAIIDKYLLGHAVLTDTPLKPGSWLDEDVGIKYSYSKAEAQYLLNNSGFFYNSGNEVYEREIEGQIQTLRLDLITNLENNYRVKAAEDIKKYLEEAGFVIDLKLMPFDELIKAMEESKYDLALTGINMKQDLVSLLHSPGPIGTRNYGTYINEDVDFLIEDIISMETNQNVAMHNYKELQKIIREDLPVISMFYKEYALVLRSKIRGTIIPDSNNLFRTIGSWYIIKEDDPKDNGDNNAIDTEGLE